MKKWLLGMLLGGFLGVFDGLSALISAPETAPEIIGIVVGSMFKGLVTGVLIGYFSMKVQSLPWAIVFGLLVGGFFAFLVALAQHLSKDRHYYWQIMLPGCLLGMIVGYATQRYGTAGVRSPA
jgi:predicted MFS family arabinose efflux permease